MAAVKLRYDDIYVTRCNWFWHYWYTQYNTKNNISIERNVGGKQNNIQNLHKA